MSEPEQPGNRPVVPFFTSLIGQSFIVVWGLFWLLALLNFMRAGDAIDSYCNNVAGCSGGLTGVTVVGVVTAALGLLITFLLRHRTENSRALHAAMPWLVLAIVVAITLLSIPVLMP